MGVGGCWKKAEEMGRSVWITKKVGGGHSQGFTMPPPPGSTRKVTWHLADLAGENQEFDWTLGRLLGRNTWQTTWEENLVDHLATYLSDYSAAHLADFLTAHLADYWAAHLEDYSAAHLADYLAAHLLDSCQVGCQIVCRVVCQVDYQVGCQLLCQVPEFAKFCPGSTRNVTWHLADLAGCQAGGAL